MKPVILKGVVSFAEQCVVAARFEAAARAFHLVLAHPATMRIEHPLIKRRLKELKDKVPAKLKTVSLDELVEGVLEG